VAATAASNAEKPFEETERFKAIVSNMRETGLGKRIIEKINFQEL